jgi:hypothetical protein
MRQSTRFTSRMARALVTRCSKSFSIPPGHGGTLYKRQSGSPFFGAPAF